MTAVGSIAGGLEDTRGIVFLTSIDSAKYLNVDESDGSCKKTSPLLPIMFANRIAATLPSQDIKIHGITIPAEASALMSVASSAPRWPVSQRTLASYCRS